MAQTLSRYRRKSESPARDYRPHIRRRRREMAAMTQPRPAPFDALAESYDRIFTDSLIGRAQRSATCATWIAHSCPASACSSLTAEPERMRCILLKEG